MVNLSSKEKFLLEGEKYQQQLAMDKFNDFTLHAKDDNLKTLFSNLSKIEESHLNLIDEMLQGKVPLINNKSIHPYYESNTFNSNNYLSVGGIMLTSLDNNYSYEDGDKIICFDALTTEELLHYTYNISKSEFEKSEFNDIFEFIINEKNENIKYINEYMNKKGMYNNTIYF